MRPDPSQPRKNLDTEAQEQLTRSVKRFGLLQPITVRYLKDDDVFQIISGERRYHAALAAALPEIPCWQQAPENREILVRQVVENWQRVDLHPFDLADTLAQLRDSEGYNQKEIAELTGKPESDVSKLLSLLKLRASIQQQYRRDKTGTLSRRHLENIAKLPDDRQEEFHYRVQKQGLTARETESLVQQTVRTQKEAPRRGAPKTSRLRIVTEKGTVILFFRKKQVEVDDVLALLDLAKQQVNSDGIGTK